MIYSFSIILVNALTYLPASPIISFQIKAYKTLIDILQLPNKTLIISITHFINNISYNEFSHQFV